MPDAGGRARREFDRHGTRTMCLRMEIKAGTIEFRSQSRSPVPGADSYRRRDSRTIAPGPARPRSAHPAGDGSRKHGALPFSGAGPRARTYTYSPQPATDPMERQVIIMKRFGRVTMCACVILWTLGGVHPAHAQFSRLLDTLKKAGGGLITTEMSTDDIVRGLKEALHIGTGNAVAVTSAVDGYYKDSRIKIPLPASVEKVRTLLDMAGYGSLVDEFELSMNRAAERAAPEAKALFWDSIKDMGFSDATKILKGRDNEATLYFKDKTMGRLQELFSPLVHESMSRVGATRTYQQLSERVSAIPFAGKLTFDLDRYVTDGALEGLFFMLAEEERKIRRNPAARVTDILKKVFGGT